MKFEKHAYIAFSERGNANVFYDGIKVDVDNSNAMGGG